MHHVELRKLFRQAVQDFTRGVGGAVVDERDLQVRVIELQERADRLLDVPLFVPSRSNERDRMFFVLSIEESWRNGRRRLYDDG